MQNILKIIGVHWCSAYGPMMSKGPEPFVTSRAFTFCHHIYQRFTLAAASAKSCPLGQWSNLLSLANLINVAAVVFVSKHFPSFFFKGNLLLHTVQYLIKTRVVFLLSQHVLKLIVALRLKRTPPPPFLRYCSCMQGSKVTSATTSSESKLYIAHTWRIWLIPTPPTHTRPGQLVSSEWKTVSNTQWQTDSYRTVSQLSGCVGP